MFMEPEMAQAKCYSALDLVVVVVVLRSVRV